ncbi:MAG: carboxymuconolactone decarboxylase family protein, partial [Nocardioidaceae bacterium]|nr:carboxymuconolactone decarboxylase family protein [Nocardioidaceae bacterium]
TRAGLSEDDTLAIRHGKPTGDDRLDALLALGREITGDVGHVQDATWQQGLDAGWSVEELQELYAHVAVNIYTNYFNHFAGTELDVPEAPELGSTT